MTLNNSSSLPIYRYPFGCIDPCGDTSTTQQIEARGITKGDNGRTRQMTKLWNNVPRLALTYLRPTTTYLHMYMYNAWGKDATFHYYITSQIEIHANETLQYHLIILRYIGGWDTFLSSIFHLCCIIVLHSQDCNEWEMSFYFHVLSFNSSSWPLWINYK